MCSRWLTRRRTPRQSAGAGPFITSGDLLDPRTADFTNPADLDVVVPVLRRICEEYDAYEQSGSKAWDQTIDIAQRPAWMRELTPRNGSVLTGSGRYRQVVVIPSSGAQ
jgi:hypothetical protein